MLLMEMVCVPTKSSHNLGSLTSSRRNKKLQVHWLVKTTHKLEQGKNPLLLCCEDSEPNQAFSTRCPSALDQEEGQARSRGMR